MTQEDTPEANKIKSTVHEDILTDDLNGQANVVNPTSQQSNGKDHLALTHKRSEVDIFLERFCSGSG
jgi:hypothetical protein